jgi:hypothetical protein
MVASRVGGKRPHSAKSPVATTASWDLVPGDVVRLCAGDLIPADGVLLSVRDLFVNQALLTGESYPVEKHPSGQGDPATEIGDVSCVALAGASVISGSGLQLICRTGRQTALGQLADTLIAKPPPTSFEIGLRQFSMLILRITLVLIVLVMAESMAFHRPWIESLLFALALAVGLTPELLPMIMTITLARGAVRLSHESVIVKNLPSIHNLGAMDVLCTARRCIWDLASCNCSVKRAVRFGSSHRHFEVPVTVPSGRLATRQATTAQRSEFAVARLTTPIGPETGRLRLKDIVVIPRANSGVIRGAWSLAFCKTCVNENAALAAAWLGS